MNENEQLLMEAQLSFWRGNKFLLAAAARKSQYQTFPEPDGEIEVEDDDMQFIIQRATILSYTALNKHESAYVDGMNLHILIKHMRALTIGIKVLRYMIRKEKEVK